MTSNSKIAIDTSGQADLFAHLAVQDRSESPDLTDNSLWVSAKQSIYLKGAYTARCR
jgi:hypothetical protein